MSITDLGRHYFQLGPFNVEWFDGGGIVESHLMWRYRGVPIAMILGANA